MKKIKVIRELRDMTDEQLNDALIESRKALFTLRLNSLTSHVKNYAKFQQLRRLIARILTITHERKNASPVN